MNRTTKNIHAFARMCGLTAPSLELLCLTREKFLDEDLAKMGFYWIIAMQHAVIIDNHPYLLGADRIEDKGGYSHFMVAYSGRNNATWDRDTGFLFKVQSHNNNLSVVG